ncbi:M28 family peptidase [Candidatus Binatia bacterium]|nr:M28 family peptidase [Candidatus Binatia bacterium]
MEDTTSAIASPTDRESRARTWIEALATLPERYAGTGSERQAAERTGTWMRAIGIADVATHPVPSAPRAGLSLAVHMGVALVGSWLGGLLGVVLTLLATCSFMQELRHRRRVLTRGLPAPDSIDVVGRAGSQTPSRRVVLSAHLDAAQAGILFSPAVADRFARSSGGARQPGQQPSGPHTLSIGVLWLGAIVTLAAWFGAHGFLFGLLHTLMLLALALGTGLGLQWAFARATPGANDNASAVAAMLTCAESLLPDLPADVELWVVGTGAEEVGCCGMHAFVAEHPGWPPATTYFVNFECVGGGALHYILSEGLLSRVNYPPMLNELARRVAAGGAFGQVTGTDLLAGTDGHVPARAGYPSLSLITLEPNGVPRHYHRVDDTTDGIDLTMVVRAADFGAAVVRAILKGEAGPVG